jgi:hypothetical protein
MMDAMKATVIAAGVWLCAGAADATEFAERAPGRIGETAAPDMVAPIYTFMSSLISWADMAAGRFWDGDVIDIRVQDSTLPGFEVCLRAAENVTWWKAIAVLDRHFRIFDEIWRQDGRHDRECMHIPIPSLGESENLQGWSLELKKARILGVHTGMYRIPVHELNGGNWVGKRFTGRQVDHLGPGLPPAPRRRSSRRARGHLSRHGREPRWPHQHL